MPICENPWLKVKKLLEIKTDEKQFNNENLYINETFDSDFF